MYRNVRVLFDASSLQAIKPLWRGRQQLVKIRLLLFIHEHGIARRHKYHHTSPVFDSSMTDTPRH